MQRHRLFLERDVLAAALGERQLQGGGRGHAVVVAGFEGERPARLSDRHQAEATVGRQHLHLRRAIGNGIQPPEFRRRLRLRAGGHHTVQRGFREGVRRPPGLAVALQGDALAVVEDEIGAGGLRFEAQRPGESRADGGFRIERGFIARRLACVGRGRDVQALADQARDAGDDRCFFVRRRERAGHRCARRPPRRHGDHHAGHQPHRRDARPRPRRAQVRCRLAAQPFADTRLLQLLQRRQRSGWRQQQIAAVVEVLAARIQLAHQPGGVERACPPPGHRGEHRDPAQRDGHGYCGRCEAPHHTGERDGHRRSQHQLAERRMATDLGEAVEGRQRHGATLRVRRVAIQRSTSTNNAISSASQGCRSRGATG